MKTILFIIISLSIGGCIYAQTTNSEVKAAYLLAEEAFASNDYKNALEYLEQCKAKMGRPNSKVLYLQILTEMELAKNEPAYYDKALSSIGAFEKAPDIEKFNEEKTLEVMKLKIRAKELKSNAAEEAIKTKEYKERAAITFQKWTWLDWPMHVKLKDLKALKKDENIFTHSSKGRDPKSGIEVLYTPFLTRENSLQCIYIKDELVIGYRAILAFGGTSYKSSSYASEPILKALYDQTADSLSRVFGFLPENRVPSGKFYAYMKKEYCWARDGKIVRLLYDADQGGKNWYARIFIDSQELVD